jgi:hypothetical protein
MEQTHKIDAEEIMGGLVCPKGFKCLQQGPENLCKAEDFRLKYCLLCLDPQPDKCAFSVSAGTSHLCECPIRFYLATERKK